MMLLVTLAGGAAWRLAVDVQRFWATIIRSPIVRMGAPPTGPSHSRSSP
jgi:hypothetical protein